MGKNESLDLEGLTPAQQKAIETLQKSQEGRLFVGTTPEIKILDFKAVNLLRQTNPEKVSANEGALFAVCGYDPTK